MTNAMPATGPCGMNGGHRTARAAHRYPRGTGVGPWGLRMGTRVIIAGSRTIDDGDADDLVRLAMDEVEDACGAIGSVLTCGSSAVAEAGARWARSCGIAVEPRAPAGTARTAPTRNELLLSRADVLVTIWDGECPSIGLLKRQAEERGLLIAEMVLSRRPRRPAPATGTAQGRPHLH